MEAQHLGIPVRDIDQTVDWYMKFQGNELIYRTEIQQEGTKVKAAFLKLGGLMFELYELSDAESQEVCRKGGGYIDHIALEVKDIDKEFMELSEAGFDILENCSIYIPFLENGVKYFNIIGPNQEEIQFIQKLL